MANDKTDVDNAFESEGLDPSQIPLLEDVVYQAKPAASKSGTRIIRKSRPTPEAQIHTTPDMFSDELLDPNQLLSVDALGLINSELQDVEPPTASHVAETLANHLPQTFVRNLRDELSSLLDDLNADDNITSDSTRTDEEI